MHDLQNISKVAKAAIVKAGKEVAIIYPSVKKIKDKNTGNDVLTNADNESEKIILNAIKENFPDHSIFSEEAGENNLESDFKWYVDPLDGSKHIARGLPYFCVTLGVSYKKEVIYGATYVPLLDQFFEAKKGQGSFLNDNRIHASSVDDFAKCMINAEFPSRNFKVEWSADQYSQSFSEYEKVIKNVFRVRMVGSGPIGLAYSAMGGFDCYVRFQPYSIEDVVAGYILVKEAGGVVKSLDGEELDILSGNRGRFVAGGAGVCDKIIELLK